VLPLDDLVVFDLSRVLAGPFCSMLLGDFGARVIKLEHPASGDDTRGFGPPFLSGESTYFLSVNRNKESVALDLKHPRGLDLARRIALGADVLVENFRPGALARLGLDYAELRQRHPRLIYCSISGFGASGDPEWVRRPGYDLVIQGIGGLASLTGEPDGPPFKAGSSIADLVAGLYGLSGILLALRARERTGRGQHVDISMLDGQISLLTYQAGIYLATGEAPKRRGNRHPSIMPYETFRAQDGYVNIAVGNDGQWRALCRAAGPPVDALAQDPRFATNRDRVAHRQELTAILEPLIGARPVAAWVELCDRAGVPSGPIHDVAEALNHPQVRARSMVVALEHATAGPIRVTGVPVRLSETPGSVRTPPPRLGEHTRAVLGELCDLEPAAIDRLQAEGVLKAL
jgi:formyl-CoA transferase/CoA:oxalate CoA-transferase